MAYQPESATYDAGVFQLETTTPVQGGVGGASNASLLNLANRTAYLKAHVDAIEAASGGYAPLLSPAFTGSPTAPTQAAGDNTTKVATDAFVQLTANGVTSKSVAGNSNVNLTAVESSTGILILTGALTGAISVIVPNVGRRWVVVNNTTGAYALTFKTAAGAGVVLTQGQGYWLYCDAVDVFVAAGGSVSLAADNLFTGITTFDKATRCKKVAIAAANIDCALADIYTKTVTGNITFTVSNIAAAGYGTCFLLDLTNGGSATVGWWANVKWASGTPPTLTVAGRDLLAFVTHDGGATWTGLVLGKALA